jgi:E3 Ubiquitin ligase
VPTYDCIQLAELSTDAPGMRVEVKGTALPVGDGMKAPWSEVACVWYEQVTRERYWDTERDSGDRRRRVEKTREVSRERSPHPFDLRDATGTVTVLREGASVDHAQKVYDRFQDKEGGGGFQVHLGSMSFGTGGDVIGHEREEWVIPPNTQLYVLGVVQPGATGPAVGQPREERFVISTRSEETLVKSALRQKGIGTVCGGIAAVAGVACIVITFFV